MMGLDSVELVMEMEETFGIVFDDLDAEKIGTVGQAYRYILGKLELSQTIPCPSAVLFYKFRRALMMRYGADRRSLRPSARIADFLPKHGRRQAWVGLRDEVGMTMPRLQLGIGLELATLLLGLGPVLGLITICCELGKISDENAVLVLFILGSFSLLGAFLLLNEFAKQIPESCETIRGTIETILGQERLAVEGKARTWQDEEVWFTLRELISEQMGVPRDYVTEEKSFVHDLGMD
jgi:acyl carrier protein